MIGHVIKENESAKFALNVETGPLADMVNLTLESQTQRRFQAYKAQEKMPDIENRPINAVYWSRTVSLARFATLAIGRDWKRQNTLHIDLETC